MGVLALVLATVTGCSGALDDATATQRGGIVTGPGAGRFVDPSTRPT